MAVAHNHNDHNDHNDCNDHNGHNTTNDCTKIFYTMKNLNLHITDK